MCIIIDANLASHVFSSPPATNFQPVFDWIEKRSGKIVFGGKNAEELRKIQAAARMIRELARQGKAHLENKKKVDDETNKVESEGKCVSDDPHIIALARVSRVRLLCSADKDLHRDFTNPRILAGPRGKVYQNSGHKNLLKHSKGCPGYRR